MKQNAKLELQIVLAIEELGEATTKEIKQFLADNFKTETKDSELNRSIRRVQKKKIIIANQVDGETAYSISGIPFIPKSDMSRIKSIAKTGDTKDAETLLEKWSKQEGKLVLPTSNKYRTFHKFEVEFEALDNIAGDHSPDSDGIGKFPKRGNTPIIPSGWWRGWFRSNLYDVNIPETVAKDRLGYGIGEVTIPNGGIAKEKGMTDKGPKTYEIVPAGSKIKFVLRYPLIGTPINTAEKLEQFLSEWGETPKRGLGANPHFFGGRLKLLSFKDLGAAAQFLK